MFNPQLLPSGSVFALNSVANQTATLILPWCLALRLLYLTGIMTRTVLMVTCLAGSLWLCASARAIVPDSGDNPYAAIVERNVFGLKPPTAAVDPASVKPPPPNITLTGLTTILGKKRALMKVLLPSAKPGQPPAETSLMLAEGQRDGEIEVLGVDIKGGMASVDDYGTITNLTFDKNGVKGGPAPPSNQPGVVGAVPAPQPAPGPFGGRAIPTRALRVPTPAAPSSANAGNPSASPTAATASAAPAGGFSQASAPPPQVAQVSAEQQIITMELVREQNKNNPDFPPFPPTPLTPG